MPYIKENMNYEIKKAEMFKAVDAAFKNPTVRSIQKKLRLSYTKASHAMDNLEELSIVSHKDMQKQRRLMVSLDEALDIVEDFYEDTRSILTNDYSRCYIQGCCNPVSTEHHTIIGMRKLSDIYGLKVPICEEHHRWCHQDAPHHPGFAEGLKIESQLAFERVHGSRQEFKKIFGEYFINDEGL